MAIGDMTYEEVQAALLRHEQCLELQRRGQEIRWLHQRMANLILTEELTFEQAVDQIASIETIFGWRSS